MGNGFRSLVYYGQGRQAPRSYLESCDAVITTYNVVAFEWKNRKRSGKVPTNSTHDLFSLKWHRLVLDEGESHSFLVCRKAKCVTAHMIRGSATQNARAVREVDAIHRWCITGTPLQNRVSDISSLLRFLRVYPYDNPKTFEADMIKPWKDEINDKPLYRLRLLMKMIALHRSKKIISLPPREEIIKEIYFSTNELKIYKSAMEGTIRLLDQTLSSGPASASTYLNAFQRMNEMRYICNHGTSKSNNNTESVEPELDQDENSTNEHELDHILDNSDEACLICGTDISEEQESSIYASSTVAVQKEQLRLCIICAQKGAMTPTLQLPTPPSSQDDIMQLNDLEKELPSKIKAIVSYIQEIPQGDKWYVVFLNCEDRIHSKIIRLIFIASSSPFGPPHWTLCTKA
jgi:SWI/SNF-related matrix-associated actin-dependent regulator of chromatin subfamily A3